MEPEFTMLSPDGLVRFMLYTDSARQNAVQMGEDVWMDLATIYGTHYGYGNKFSIRFTENEEGPVAYVVAMVPLLRQIDHPEEPERKIPLRVVYLARADEWDQFEPITQQNISSFFTPVN